MFRKSLFGYVMTLRLKGNYVLFGELEVLNFMVMNDFSYFLLIGYCKYFDISLK